MKNSKGKVVITGGEGFIGSNLVNFLVDEGFEVHSIDNLSVGEKRPRNKNAKYHKKDIRKLSDIVPIIKGSDYVFHCAALPRVLYSIEHPIETNEVNVTGTLNVLEASRKAGIKRLIYSASGSAYGEQNIMPLSEDMLASPVNPYGLQKYIGELECRMYSTVYDLQTVCLRYFNIYGPGLEPEGAYALVIGKFIKQRKENKPLTITGDGTQTRDFTHVNDAVRANILAMESDNVGNGEVINIGTGKQTSVNELAEMFGGSTEFIPAILEAKHSVADNAKAKKLLGWGPSITLKKGIEELKNMFDI